MLRLSARAAAGVALPVAGFAGCSAESSTSLNSTDVEPTDSGSSVTGLPLPIPERLFGSVFNLEMRIGGREFLQDRTTPTKGYNGDFLGPTLVLRSGTDVSLNVTNNIGVPTTTHWHGFHVPAAMDGGPHQIIQPGAVWTASFPILNRAATYWYHPHPHASLTQGAIFDPMGTGYQVYEGLAGMIIVEDSTSDALPLPRTYGEDDIPLILQDRRFQSDGSLLHFPDDFNAASDPALRKGGNFLVNGTEGPVLDVEAGSS
ncbi:MAG: multicopper oxidase domain-containing protein [Gemmatimonadetes bacterium]|nr:multicopper oxidase domain-containing protein [Gemmatimonadota bacterium]